MWSRIGGAFILFGGLVSTMMQAVLFLSSPLIGVAFADVVVGVIGIFSASYMTRRAGRLYLIVTLVRLVLGLALFLAFLFTFKPQSYLSHLLCKEGTLLALELENGQTPSPAAWAEARRRCDASGAVVVGLVAAALILSTTLFWYPCFRCSLYLDEGLAEKEALEGLLHDVEDVEEDEVLMALTASSPYKATTREKETKDANDTIVAPPAPVEN